MGRFWGNHPGTRQVRGWRKVKTATHEERLAGMEIELQRRIRLFGEGDSLVEIQREAIAREKANHA